MCRLWSLKLAALVCQSTLLKQCYKRLTCTKYLMFGLYNIELFYAGCCQQQFVFGTSSLCQWFHSV